ncbi:MAG: hypothetical protein RLZZ548_1106, partial [Bacteroidota bacterium]
PVTPFQDAFGAVRPIWRNGFDALPNIGIQCQEKERKKEKSSDLLFEHGPKWVAKIEC